MRGLSLWLYRWASAPAALALLSVAGLLAYLFNFSDTALSVSRLARLYGQPILDLRPWYSADAVRALLAAYGTAGRQGYLHFLAFDTLFLLCYGVGFALLISLLRRRLPRPGWFNLLPLAVAIADALENLCSYLDLVSYPDFYPLIAWAGGAMTSGKHLLSAASLLCLGYSAWRAGRRAAQAVS